MRFVPHSDRVVVRLIEDEEEQEERLIIIPDTVKDKPSEGEVVAVGPGKTENGVLVPMEAKLGARVVFGKYAGTEMTIDGEEVIVMRDSDIMGTIPKEA